MKITINRFLDEYRFLSNMTLLETPYKVPGGFLLTGEHMYQYAKSKDEKWRQYVLSISNPYTIRKKSRCPDHCTLRADWEEVKDEIMSDVVDYRFSKFNPQARYLLIRTKGIFIREGNYWGDDYWGWDLKKEVGENKLGKLIMDKREVLLKDTSVKKYYTLSALSLASGLDTDTINNNSTSYRDKLWATFYSGSKPFWDIEDVWVKLSTMGISRKK